MQPELYFEDLTPGRVFDLGTTVVDRDEMLAFARRFDPQPFHVDEEAGKASMFGALTASGWFTAALWMRAYADGVLARAASLGRRRDRLAGPGVPRRRAARVDGGPGGTPLPHPPRPGPGEAAGIAPPE